MEDLNDWLPVTEQICIHARYSDDGSSVKFLQYLDSILTIENNQVFAPLIAYSHYRNDRITCYNKHISLINIYFTSVHTVYINWSTYV